MAMMSSDDDSETGESGGAPDDTTSDMNSSRASEVTGDSGSTMGSSCSCGSQSDSDSASSSRSDDSSAMTTASGSEQDAIHIFELCCAPDSNLVRCSRQAMLKASRLTLETNYDFAQVAVAEKATSLVKRSGSGARVWISVPCKAYSALQNMRKGGKTSKSMKVLQRKRDQTDVLVKHTCQAGLQAMMQDGYFYYEWPKGCHGWVRCAPLNQFLQQCQTHGVAIYTVRVDACCFGMKNRLGTKPMSKSIFSSVQNCSLFVIDGMA